jgi:plasmid stabilization system protein ParE
VSLPVVFRELALDDVREAHAWYEAQSAGLGGQFLQAIDVVVGLISDHPLACAVAYRNLRRALLPGFPYALFYQALPDRARVVAWLQQRRDPKAIRKRATRRNPG